VLVSIEPASYLFMCKDFVSRRVHMHCSITRSNRTAEEWVCLPASELLPLDRPTDQHSGDGACDLRVFSPISFDAMKRGTRFRRCAVRVFPRRTRSSDAGRPAAPCSLWQQLDEVHIDPVQSVPSSRFACPFHVFREADSACLPQCAVKFFFLCMARGRSFMGRLSILEGRRISWMQVGT
jgi:hypothetical protein